MARLLESFKNLNTEEVPRVFVTEVLHTASKQKDDRIFDFPKAKEMVGSLNKGSAKVVCRD